MITEEEFEEIIGDRTKRIDGDIRWDADDDHWPAATFRVPVLSASEHKLDLVGRWNPMANKLSYTLVRWGTGRIYGLDMGVDHRNPGRHGTLVGETHKHYWTEEYRDKMAYAPPDITAPRDRPTEVWAQFRAEAGIEHRGTLYTPGSSSEEAQ